MAFKKLDFKKFSQQEMLERSKSFLSEISSRRTVREFSNKIFPINRKIKSFIRRKLNKKAMISVTYIAKSGYPWNDITAMNDWNLIKESIIKFSI